MDEVVFWKKKEKKGKFRNFRICWLIDKIEKVSPATGIFRWKFGKFRWNFSKESLPTATPVCQLRAVTQVVGDQTGCNAGWGARSNRLQREVGTVKDQNILILCCRWGDSNKRFEINFAHHRAKLTLDKYIAPWYILKNKLIIIIL